MALFSHPMHHDRGLSFADNTAIMREELNSSIYCQKSHSNEKTQNENQYRCLPSLQYPSSINSLME